MDCPADSSGLKHMTPALLGKKIGMTRVYDESGTVIPVTVVQAGPCAITQVKNVQTDGYDAVQIGFIPVKAKFSTFALIGHTAKVGVEPHRHFAEVRLSAPAEVKAGDFVNVELFKDVAFVDVTGTSKGKGTAGVMKRHNFGGQPASHGTERKHRSPGSIGSYATDRGHSGKPKKGLKMAGRMGQDRVTTRNHQLVSIDGENNLLLIKGALPGANGGLLFVRKSVTARVKAAAK